jgi:hypothetical protein
LIKREFYCLDDAANMIGCDADDLVHLAAKGTTQVIVPASNQNVALFIKDGDSHGAIEAITERYCRVRKEDMARFESGNLIGEEIYLKKLIPFNNDDGAWSIHPSYAIKMSTKTLFMLTSDIELLRDELKQSNESNKKNSAKKRGGTKITVFLSELCRKQDINTLSGESLIRSIKPLVGQANCPVDKYHGFYDEVCVDWKPGSGSTQGSWGKKAFQNFVSAYKTKNRQKPVKKIT